MTDIADARLASRLKEIWRLAGRVNPFQRSVLLVVVGYPILGTALYEGFSYGYTNPRFLIAVPLSYLVFVICYFAFMLPFYKVPILTNSTLGKLVAVYFAFLAKTLVMVYVVGQTPQAAFELWLERAPGDATLTLVAWLAFATATVSNNDYRLALKEFNSVSDELERQKFLRTNAAAMANKELRAVALKSLQTELEKIRKGLRSVREGKDAWRISVEIKSLVQSKVRPLSQRLMKQIDLLAALPVQRLEPISPAKFPKLKIIPRLDARIAFAYLAAAPNVIVTVLQLSDWIAALSVALALIASGLIAQLMSLLWPRSKRTSLEIGIVWGASVILLSYLPMLYSINLMSKQHSNLAVIQLTAFFVCIFLAIVFSFWATFQRSRIEQLAEIQVQQSRIKKELALIDQSLWLARRSWAYLIHGSVQGALTVASARLVIDPEPSKQTISQVLWDVEKARRALLAPPSPAKKAAELLEDIKNSWVNVCDVDLDIDVRAHLALEKNQHGASSLVEVCKELISNAYRHGGATVVKISVRLDNEGDLVVLTRNNGMAISDDFQAGIGFEMFDQLCSEWKISDTTSPSFEARIPLSVSV